MADPLSIAASVVGLIGFADQLSERLGLLIISIKDAPIESLALSNELNDLTTIISLIQEVYLSNRPAAGGPSRSLLHGPFVATLNRARVRLQKVDSFLHSISASQTPGHMRVSDRISWSLRKKKIQTLTTEIKQSRQELHLMVDIDAKARWGNMTETLREFCTQTSIFQGESRDITSRTLTAISDLSTTTQQLVNADTPINGGERDPGDIPSSNESSGEDTNLTRIDSAPFYEQLWDWQTSVLTRVNLELRRCDPCNGPCDCVCHLRQEWRLSNLLRGVLGSMFVGYSGLAFLKPTCNVEACKGSRGRSITVKYLFPSWFTARAFHFAANTCFGGPKFYLFVQKRVPEFGVNTLNSLVRNGNIEGARKLLEAREACPNDAETARGRSALHLAIAGGHIELTKLLMSFGADLDLQDDEGISPIQRVAWHIFTKRVNYGQAQNIFTSTAYIESVELTAVHKAVLSVIHVDLNQFLSLPEHGSLIDEADANLRTPLHWAASVGNCQAVKVLLQHKAETSKRDYCGDTPLIKAVSQGCLDCVKELLVSQADINEANPKGEKPIHFAAQQSVPMVECLLQARANINDTTAANYTPFDFAVMANRTEVGVYLLQRGVDANRGASNGRSPIFCALRCQSYECIEMLLSLPEIELSIPDGEGNSVLHWVARMQDVRIIEIIRAVKPRGLTIEDANSEGETALDLAKCWAGIMPEFLVAFRDLLEDIGAGWSDMNDGEEFFDAEENLMS